MILTGFFAWFMSDKILVWVEVGLIQFGIAKYLKKIYDCELFAICDFNHHIKKSFQIGRAHV